MWRYQAFARKLTWYFIGVYIIKCFFFLLVIFEKDIASPKVLFCFWIPMSCTIWIICGINRKCLIQPAGRTRRLYTPSHFFLLGVEADDVLASHLLWLKWKLWLRWFSGTFHWNWTKASPFTLKWKLRLLQREFSSLSAKDDSFHCCIQKLRVSLL